MRGRALGKGTRGPGLDSEKPLGKNEAPKAAATSARVGGACGRARLGGSVSRDPDEDALTDSVTSPGMRLSADHHTDPLDVLHDGGILDKGRRGRAALGALAQRVG